MLLLCVTHVNIANLMRQTRRNMLSQILALCLTFLQFLTCIVNEFVLPLDCAFVAKLATLTVELFNIIGNM